VVLQRQVKVALHRAGIAKRGTPHTLGHHVLNRGPAGVRSPVDRMFTS